MCATMAASQPAIWCARPAQVRTHSNQPSRRWWRKVFLCVREADAKHGTVFPDARKRTQMTGTVSRSIAQTNNSPKNVPIHGLNVLAFARIQTRSIVGLATRRKGRCAGWEEK